MDEGPAIILVSGIMAAGKSSVAQALAERFGKSVHLRGDLFRRMIVRGQAEMTAELDPAAYEQLRLRYRIAAAAARLYLEAGFTVVYQDIIIGHDLAEVVDYYRRHALYVVVLCPAAAAAAARDSARTKTAYHSPGEVSHFDRVLRSETPRLGLWLDTTHLSVAETVDQILHRLAQALIRR